MLKTLILVSWWFVKSAEFELTLHLWMIAQEAISASVLTAWISARM